MFICENYIFLDICDISVNLFNTSRWIFSHKCILYKVLNKFSLSGIASPVIPLLHVISFVVSVSGEGDDEPNKVAFVLINIHGEFAATMY